MLTTNKVNSHARYAFLILVLLAGCDSVADKVDDEERELIEGKWFGVMYDENKDPTGETVQFDIDYIGKDTRDSAMFRVEGLRELLRGDGRGCSDR